MDVALDCNENEHIKAFKKKWPKPFLLKKAIKIIK